MTTLSPAHENGRNPSRNTPPGGRQAAWFSATAFVAFAAVIAWRFAPLMPKVFFGDDLTHLLHFRDGACGMRLRDLLHAACAEKFRPAFDAVMIAEFRLFDTAISGYMAVNVLIEAACATVVFAVARRLVRNRAAAAALALAFCVSHFAVFQLTQVDGPVEGLALLLFLGSLYSLVSAGDDAASAVAWRRGWIALLLAFLAGYVHERYLALAPGLLLAFVSAPAFRRLRGRRLALLLAACVLMPLLNVTYKLAVLHTSVLVGTGGTHVSMDGAAVLDHFHQAALSIIGINTGPEYLTGVHWMSLPRLAAWASAIGIALVYVTLTAGLVLRMRRAPSDPGRWLEAAWLPVTLAAFMLLLLAPALVTIRVEQRWLLASFTMLLLLVAWASGIVGERAGWVRVGAPILFAACFVGVDSLILRDFGRFYLAASTRFAEAVERDVASATPDDRSPIAFIADASVCRWVLHQGEFFRIYGGAARKIECVPSLSSISPSASTAWAHIFQLLPSGRLADVAGALQRQRLAKNAALEFDFLAGFDRATISSDALVSSPTGRGVFPARWNSVTGPVDTLTVVTGFSTTYDRIGIDPGTYLSFGTSMVYPSLFPARATVTIRDEDGATRTVYSERLRPPAQGDELIFAEQAIALDSLAGRTVSITFAVDTPAGDSRGHWIAFSSPKLLVPGCSPTGGPLPPAQGPRGSPDSAKRGCRSG